LPIIALLRDYFKIDLHDSTRSIQEKVTSKLLTLDPSLQDSVPPILDLLDSLDDAHPLRSLELVQRRQCTYQAIIRLFLSECGERPVIAVFEDLHFNDPLSLGLLNELIVAAQNARLLMLVSYRPDYRNEWRDRPNHHQLRLDPLGGQSLAEFLEALLGTDPGLPTLKSFLVERANGNPFFVEEIVRSLVDSGVLEGVRTDYRLVRPLSNIKVPPTVQAVLAARIDALPAAEKRLLEEAAVIGYDARLTLLQAICGLTEDRLHGLLNNLQAAEFLYETQLFPDLQYTFKHSLTHDVTYSGVLHERRRDIHARIVDAIEKLYADRLGEHVERLAYHTVQSGLQEKAVYYLRQAATKATERSAPLDARAWFEEALDILKALPESQARLEQAFEIRLELRPVLRQLGEGRLMLECLREAEALAERLKDDHRLGQVCAFMTTVQATLDELEEAVATGTRALEIAERLGDLRLRIVAASHLGQAYYYMGEYESVIEFAGDSLAALPADWAQENFGTTVPPSVVGRTYLMMGLAELGRFPESARYEAETIQLGEATRHAFTIAWAYFGASVCRLLKGDWAKARSLIDHWIAMLRTANVAIQLPWAVASSAWVLAQFGEASEALSQAREAEQLLERQAAKGAVGHQIWAYDAVSRACLLLGYLDEARRLSDRTVESSRRHPGFTAHALRLLGDIASHPGQFDARSGATHYLEALALARLHGMRPLIAHCHLGLGKLYSHIGNTECAHNNLGTAATMYREMDMDYWLEQAEAAFDQNSRPTKEALDLARVKPCRPNIPSI
jgi:tetratricopeptide (TPR) repeat protein